ncbi:dephospho-CoA kinase [Myxococcota bacterium]|nr:dephospho-CoA kinase [Myxococcota bacterium]
MTICIGLSGGIGSGKTTVADMLKTHGAVVIDADEIVREVQSPGSPVLAEIAEAFGAEVLDTNGALNREALGSIVFRDPEARGRLNRIVHAPVIGEMVRRLYTARDQGEDLVILDIPLLFEGQQSRSGAAAIIQFDATVLVWAPESLQIERQISRNGYGRDEAERRVRAQLSLDEKRAMADHVIDNSGSLDDTAQQVAGLVEVLVTQDAR